MFENEKENIENGISINPRAVIIDILASVYHIELPSVENISNSTNCTQRNFIIKSSDDSIEIYDNITTNELDRLLSHKSDIGIEDKFKYRLASLYGAMGNYKREIEILKQIDNITEKTFYHEKLAESLLKDSNGEGVNILKQINSVDSLLSMSLYYLQKNDLENAERLLIDILAIEPTNYKALSTYSVVSLLKCDYNLVVRLLRKLSNYHGLNEYSSFLFALAYYYNGNIKKALKWGIIGININPLNKDIINLISHLSQDIEIKNIEKYLLNYLSVKTESFVIERLARYYYHAGKYGKSLELLKNLLIKDDKNPSTWNNLAITSLKIGKLENVSKYYLQALKCMGDEVNITILSNYFRYLSLHQEYKLLIDLFELMKVNQIVVLNYNSYRSIFSYYFESLRNIGDIEKYQELLLTIYKSNEEQTLRIAVLNELICFFSTYTIDIDLLSIYSVELESYINKINDFSEKMRVINNVIFGYLECNRSPNLSLIEYFRSNLDKNPYYNATYGLYYLKKGNLKKGIEYYENSIKYSSQTELTHSLKQKRDIETAKYYLGQKNISNATLYFNKVLKRNNVICPYYIDIAKMYLKEIEKS